MEPFVMANGDYFSIDELRKLQEPLNVLDEKLKKFAARIDADIIINSRGWPCRKMNWEDNSSIERQITISYQSEEKNQGDNISFGIWCSAFKDKYKDCLSRYSKGKLVIDGLTDPLAPGDIMHLYEKTYHEMMQWDESDLKEVEYFEPLLSPDGRYELFKRVEERDSIGGHALYLKNLQTGKIRLLDFYKYAQLGLAKWAPDGRAFFINQQINTWFRGYRYFPMSCFVFSLEDLDNPINVKNELEKQIGKDKYFMRVFKGGQLNIRGEKWLDEKRLKILFEGAGQYHMQVHFEYTLGMHFIETQY